GHVRASTILERGWEVANLIFIVAGVVCLLTGSILAFLLLLIVLLELVALVPTVPLVVCCGVVLLAPSTLLGLGSRGIVGRGGGGAGVVVLLFLLSRRQGRLGGWRFAVQVLKPLLDIGKGEVVLRRVERKGVVEG